MKTGVAMSAPVFRVVIDGNRSVVRWNEYSHIREAQRAAVNLRALGMTARVERNDKA